jgi:hypothetical protein
MQRITMRDLEAVVRRINDVTGSPVEPYKTVNKKHISNIGNYHLDGAYGGWKLVRMMNESGGIKEVTYGFVSKRELYNLMHSYLNGLEAK